MGNLFSRIVHAVGYLKRHGPRDFLRRLSLRGSEFYHDHRLGIRTRATVATGGGEDSIDYMPIPYRHLTCMLAKVRMDEDCVFLDYGAGMGRVVAVAATHPVRRVIGVELSRDMAAIARRNLAQARGLICRDVQFVEQDAADFVVPEDVSVIHFYNPFIGETLAQVVRRIHDSVVRRPRTIQIIFFNHGQFDRVIRGADWVRQIFSGRFYPHYGGALYETASAKRSP